MNNTHALLLALSLALLTGCDYEARQKRAAESTTKQDARVWIESSLGVKYFYDCIDGFKFIISDKHYSYGIAGPIGGCE